MSPRLIDIGANLTHDSFDADRDAVLERAADAGVTRLVLTGSSVTSSRAAAALAQAHPGRLYATAGMHPHHASDYTDDAHATFRDLLKHSAVVAVGECGLDFFRDFSPRDAQRVAFRRQLDLAIESGLPVFLHQRDAHEDFLAMLEPVMPHISRAVAHCFTGDRRMLADYLDLGLYIGITGWICDERRGLELREAAAQLPLERVMIETDAPYLLPRTLRPKPKTRRNEPAWLPEVLRVLADCMGRDQETVAKATTENAVRFFGLPPD